MDCSVVITTYNRAKLLADTLLSLADQQVSPAVRWEVIVVDNNSRDETEDVVRRCSETTSLRIRHVFEPRQGQSFARNRGIEAAEGAVILFTDDDIIPNPDWVSAMLRAIDADDCEGAGGKVLPLWEGEVPSWLSGRSDLLSWLALVDSDEACARLSPGGQPPHRRGQHGISSERLPGIRPVPDEPGASRETDVRERRSSSSIGSCSKGDGSATTRPSSCVIGSGRIRRPGSSSFGDTSITGADRPSSWSARTGQLFSEWMSGGVRSFSPRPGPRRSIPSSVDPTRCLFSSASPSRRAGLGAAELAIRDRRRHLGVDTLLGSAHALHDHVRPQLFDDPILRDDGPAHGLVGLQRLMTALEPARIDERPPDDDEMTPTRIEWLEPGSSQFFRTSRYWWRLVSASLRAS